MRRSVSSVGTVAFVIAAMALGRAITDLVPTANVVATPFVHSGGVGQNIDLGFANIKVTSVRVTPLITGSSAAQAGGRWLVVGTEMTSTKKPMRIGRPTLIDTEGRVSLSTERGQECRGGANLPTDVPWQVTFCFDVAKESLAGGRVLFARGDYEDGGDGFRRDAVAEVDLGLTSSEVDTLWKATAPIDVKEDGIVGATQ